jgi:hypothetical protein
MIAYAHRSIDSSPGRIDVVAVVVVVTVMDVVDIWGATEEEEEDGPIIAAAPSPSPSPPLQEFDNTERDAIENYVDRQHQHVVNVVVSVVPFRSSRPLNRRRTEIRYALAA